MDAARTVIRAEAEEYGRLGLLGPRFREIMRMRIESTVYSFEFSNMQRDALDAEFLWPANGEPEDIPALSTAARLSRSGHLWRSTG